MSLFIIGCGLVVLETAANPYVTELGDRSTAASRLNLAQSFNGLGCILAPLIMGQILFTGDEGINVALPYSVMGVVVLIVALIFSRVKLPEITDGPSAGDYDAQSTALSYPSCSTTSGLFSVFRHYSVMRFLKYPSTASSSTMSPTAVG